MFIYIYRLQSTIYRGIIRIKETPNIINIYCFAIGLFQSPFPVNQISTFLMNPYILIESMHVYIHLYRFRVLVNMNLDKHPDT